MPPTDAQLEAGNYRKGHTRFAGLAITIENPVGSTRSGVDRGGKRWSTRMKCSYGYFKGSLGVDGDHLDCYLGPDEAADTVYLVNTMAPPNFTKPDEQKVMLGFNSEEAARRAFLLHYDNPRFLGSITAMPLERFKRELRTTRERPRMLKALVLFFRPAPAS